MMFETEKKVVGQFMLPGNDISYFNLSTIYLKLVQQCGKNAKEFLRLVGILSKILDKEAELLFCILTN